MKIVFLKLKKIISFIVTILILLFLSNVIHEEIGEKVSDISITLIKIFLPSIFIITGIIILINIWQCILNSTSEKLWIKLKDGVRPNVMHYLDSEKKLGLETFIQLYSVYHSDDEIIKKLLEFLKNWTDEREKTIAYMFLKNFDSIVVPEMNNIYIKLEKNCNKILNEFNVFLTNNDINSLEVNKEFILGLLYSCLGYGFISKNNLILMYRRLLNWIDKVESHIVVERNEGVLETAIILVPLIEKKMQKTGIRDENIEKSIHKIKNSKWTKSFIYKSYNLILKELESDVRNMILINKSCVDICLLNLYYDYLSEWKKTKLLNAIKRQKQDLGLKLGREENVVSLLLYASPLRMIEINKDEMIYNFAEITCLCADRINFNPS